MMSREGNEGTGYEKEGRGERTKEKGRRRNGGRSVREGMKLQTETGRRERIKEGGKEGRKEEDEKN
jgi:hypothetical protein